MKSKIGINIDSVFLAKNRNAKTKYFLNQEKKFENKNILIANNNKRRNFFAGKSSFYFDCGNEKEVKMAEFKKKHTLLDSLNYKIVDNYKTFQKNDNDFLYRKYQLTKKKIEEYNNRISEKKLLFLENISLVRLWNASVLTAVLIGMISMSFIYRYLGQGVSAKDKVVASGQIVSEQMVKGESDEKWTTKKEDEYITKVMTELKEKDKRNFEKRAKKMVKGYPIEKMLPYIFKQDKTTASFLIAIAKKESNWGKRVPVLNGQDCYNYWGYRGKRKKMGSGGHTCFESRRDAIDTVGKRLNKLIKDYGKNTPAKMIVWKCGNICNTHSNHSIKKWINDVDLYFEKLNK